MADKKKKEKEKRIHRITLKEGLGIGLGALYGGSGINLALNESARRRSLARVKRYMPTLSIAHMSEKEFKNFSRSDGGLRGYLGALLVGVSLFHRNKRLNENKNKIGG